MPPRHTACATCGRWTRGRPCPVHPEARQVDVLDAGAAPLAWRADTVRIATAEGLAATGAGLLLMLAVPLPHFVGMLPVLALAVPIAIVVGHMAWVLRRLPADGGLAEGAAAARRRAWTRMAATLVLGPAAGAALLHLFGVSFSVLLGGGTAVAGVIVGVATWRHGAFSKELARLLEAAAAHPDAPAAATDRSLQACPACGRWTPDRRCAVHPDVDPEPLFGPDTPRTWRAAVLQLANRQASATTLAAICVLMGFQGTFKAIDILLTEAAAPDPMDLGMVILSFSVVPIAAVVSRGRLSALRAAPTTPSTMHPAIDALQRRALLWFVSAGLLGAALAGTAQLTASAGLDRRLRLATVLTRVSQSP